MGSTHPIGTHSCDKTFYVKLQNTYLPDVTVVGFSITNFHFTFAHPGLVTLSPTAKKKRCRFCDGFTLSISKDDEEYWLMLVKNLMHVSMRIFCPKHITLVPAYNKFGYYEQSTGSRLKVWLL